MSVLEAYNIEKECWRWASMPAGAEALLLAFTYCLWLRTQGLSFEQVMGVKPKKRSGK